MSSISTFCLFYFFTKRQPTQFKQMHGQTHWRWMRLVTQRAADGGWAQASNFWTSPCMTSIVNVHTDRNGRKKTTDAYPKTNVIFFLLHFKCHALHHPSTDTLHYDEEMSSVLATHKQCPNAQPSWCLPNCLGSVLAEEK